MAEPGAYRDLRADSSGATPLDASGLIAGFAEYLHRSTLTAGTQADYLGTMRRFAEWAEGREDWPPRDPWHRSHLTRDYKSQLQASRCRASTINVALSVLDCFWTHLGFGSANVRRESIPQQAPRGLTAVEEKALLRAAERTGIREHAVILLMLMAGPRLAETCALDIQDVTLTARTGDLHIRRGKGGRQRHVPLGPQVRPTLAAWLDERRIVVGKLAGRRGEPIEADPTALWLTSRGTRAAPNTVDTLIRGLARTAGVSASAHTLRHTAVHRWKRAGIDPFMIAEMAGHASLRTTGLYGLATADEKAEQVEALTVDY